MDTEFNISSGSEDFKVMVKACEIVLNSYKHFTWITNVNDEAIFINQSLANFLKTDKNNSSGLFGSGFYKSNKKILDISGKKVIEDKKTETFEINHNYQKYRITKEPLFSGNNIIGIINYANLISDEITEKDTKILYLNELLKNIPFQIYFKDTLSRFTLINNTQAKVIGIKNVEEAVGKTDFDFFTSDHAQSAFKDEQRIINGEIPVVSKTERVRQADGNFKWMMATKVPVKNNDGKIIGIVGISYDITDKIYTENQLKQAKEKAEESDKLKTAFLANMSHEIRTPMNGIIGFVNLLKEPEITDEEKNEFFSHIETCTRTLLNLIDDIIDISKIESGQLSISKVDTDINEIVLELVKTFEETKKSLYESAVSLQLNIPVVEEPLVILTDAYRLRQIITNLLSNAFKFTSEGSIELGYFLKNETIEFYVKDTGRGIPEDKKDVIFQRFGQINQSIYITNKGTGLGLSICKNLVQILGGEIWFESEEGKGSTFYFTLPLTKEPDHVLSLKKAENTNNDWTGKSVLIAGKNPELINGINNLIEDTGINVFIASSVAEAFEIYEKNARLNIIIIECCNNQIKFKDFLSKLEVKRNDIPVLLLIDSTFNFLDNDPLREYTTDIIIHPIEKQELLNKIQKYIL